MKSLLSTLHLIFCKIINSVHERLEGGDLRSIGGTDVVLEDLYKDTSLFDEIFECLYSDKPVVKMRSADVIEKFTLKHPEYLQPYKDKLLHEIAGIDQKEVRWHVCQRLDRGLRRKRPRGCEIVTQAWV